jgi:hypothetical protein
MRSAAQSSVVEVEGFNDQEACESSIFCSGIEPKALEAIILVVEIVIRPQNLAHRARRYA